MPERGPQQSPEELFGELRAIMARLRSPDGCPWDKEQHLSDLGGYILEEAEEAAEAISKGDPEHVAEELGDLIFNIIFAARIGEEEGTFDMAQVLAGIRDKMVRRHPHVFGDAEASTPAEVLVHWNRAKDQETRKG
jgi:tetrapyrrole methylase family protein/MazG family protein